MTEVTAAIIHKSGQLLICQRPKGKSCEMLWEFPGGKIEGGETLENCLIRECQEELGVIVKPEVPIRIVEYKYPNITVNIHFFCCKLVEGEPRCIEHNDIQWRIPDEIIKLPLCPADKIMLELSLDDIKKHISSTAKK